MSDDGKGWLWLDGCEVLNNARFLANIQAFNNADQGWGHIDLTANPNTCPTYTLNPCSTTQWDPIVMTDPLTSPWVDVNFPQSERFVGFWVDTVQTSGIGERAIEQRGTAVGGANFGAWRYKHREISYSVILCGLDSGGLQWGIDWLTSALTGCGPCPDMSAMIRLSCPDVSVPEEDLWTLKGVGLIDPPVWGDPVTDRSGCVLKRVTFVLGASDPCRYTCAAPELPRTRVPYNAVALPPNTAPYPYECMNGLKWMCGPFPELRMCATIPAPGVIGTTDAIITIESGSTGSPFFYLKGGPNPLNLACGSSTIPLCMDMLVGGLGPNETLVIDSSSERVWRTVPGGVTKDGLDHVIPPVSHAPTFMSLSGCEDGIVWLEPKSGRCLSDDIYVTIESVHRVCQ